MCVYMEAVCIREHSSKKLHVEVLFSHKKNEIVPLAATWMDLEIIILSEVSQTEKDNYHMILLIRGV